AGRVLQRELPVGVAAVDDDVARLAGLDELVDGLGRRIARGYYDPHHPRLRLERLDEILESVGAGGALRDVSLHRVGWLVECDELVAAIRLAHAHVAADAAPPGDLHRRG